MTPTQRSILLVVLLAQGVSVGLTYGILPVFLEPLEVAFDAPRTWISAGQILVMLALTSGGILTGAILDRGHARLVMIAGAMLMAAAQVVAGTATGLPMLALAALMAGFAVPSIGPLTGASLITRAFDEDRGRALGLMSIGPPLGSGLFAALAGWGLIVLDWRGTFLLFAAVPVVLLVPLIVWGVPMRFETTGGVPEAPATPPEALVPVGGEGMPAPLPHDPATRPGPHAPTPPASAVLGRPVFWWTAAVFALVAGITTGWTVHVAAYLGGVGLDAAARSGVLAAQFWMGIPGALVFGLLADRVGPGRPFLALILLQALTFLAYAFFATPLVVTLLGLAMGFAAGGFVPLYMMLLGSRVGPDSVGRAMGFSTLLMLPVMAGSVLLAAALFEADGSYVRSVIVFSLGMVAAIACLLGSNWSAARR